MKCSAYTLQWDAKDHAHIHCASPHLHRCLSDHFIALTIRVIQIDSAKPIAVADQNEFGQGARAQRRVALITDEVSNGRYEGPALPLTLLTTKIK